MNHLSHCVYGVVLNEKSMYCTPRLQKDDWAAKCAACSSGSERINARERESKTKSKFYDIFATRALDVKLKSRFLLKTKFQWGREIWESGSNVYNRRHTNTKACLNFFPIEKKISWSFLPLTLAIFSILIKKTYIGLFFFGTKGIFYEFFSGLYLAPFTTHSHTTHSVLIHNVHEHRKLRTFPPLIYIYLDLYKSPSSNSG